ncbi:hypothetical protein BDW62DRAFT_218639 [Aspergillus aurantiobrunneus]
MFRVFVGSDGVRKDMGIEHNLHPPPSCLAVSPIDSFENVLPTMSFDPQANLAQYPETTTKCEQLQMGDHVGADRRCSITPNGLPNGDLLRQEFQTGKEQYHHWHMDFQVAKSTKSNLSNAFQSRSTSENSHHWSSLKIDPSSPGSQFNTEDISSNDTGAPIPDLLHPIPRHSPYAVTSYFASERVPETPSAFGQTEIPQGDHIPGDSKCLVQGSDWTNDDLIYPSLLLEEQSTGTTSVTSVTENYTTTATDGTYNSDSVSPWPSLKVQEPWDAQPSNTFHSNDDLAWNNVGVYSEMRQQHGHFDQFPVSNDEINGLPYLGFSGEMYIKPSSLLSSSMLDPFGSARPNLYLNGNAITYPEYSQIQYPEDNFAYQTELRPDDSTGSFFNTFGHISYQPDHAARMTPWNNDARNALLIEYKRRGLSYRDIKKIGGFKEAESTLRGRYRTLTKSKEQRVRRPYWHEKDIRLLCEAVDVYSNTDRRNPCGSTYRSRRPNPPPKIPWKKVAQYILTHGGSYHFGNSTCKKKWCEVQTRFGRGFTKSQNEAAVFSSSHSEELNV